MNIERATNAAEGWIEAWLRVNAHRRAVVAALGEGSQIAAALFLSPRTVHHHVAGALAKLGADSRAAAVAVAQAAGLLPPESSTGT